MRYTREDGCRAWLIHGMLKPDTLTALLEEYGSAEAVYDTFIKAGGEFLRARSVSDHSIASLRQNSVRDKMHDMLVLMRKMDIGIMSISDALYPDMLREIQQPPGLLFYRGNPDCLMHKCVTIVGSRSASPQTLTVTRNIARDLSNAGITIVSGLATGVDSVAHEGCLEGKSPTVAILACGMAHDYPAESIELRERIVRQGGLLLSEYPLDMRSSRHVFQMRNRIMSGLSRGVLMMEARIRSGSMITVHHALDQGREVFAYPGMPGSESAEGAHQLLREGAIYFTSARDVLEDLGWDDNMPAITQSQKRELPDMTAEQRQLYALLGQGEMSFDELAEQSGIPTPQLSVSLTLMQMSGVIRALPGKSYCRN